MRRGGGGVFGGGGGGIGVIALQIPASTPTVTSSMRSAYHPLVAT